MPRKTVNVALLSYTPDPENVVALAARTCYSASDLNALKKRVSKRDQTDFIKMVTQMGHLSTTEHVSFTFAVEGVSRALLAQITRHRIASFSVQSQRYVSMENNDGETFGYIVPPAIEALGEEAVKEFDAQMAQMQSWYNNWQARLSKAAGGGEKANEDARFVLPNACETRFIVTMNARELMHFFSLRCCGRAQWEIRELAWRMLEEVRKVAPALFGACGPACLSGPCPEGNKSCGKAAQMKARSEELNARIQENK
ncbi:MAG: FAD-dependent thymidylate synthase [Clostridiales bacterium]|nr:FAD-dependent thymidylate synthase [Clostridiales bacterium]